MDALWVLLCGFMVLDMQAGFLCLEAGLSRVKNAANVALKNVSDVCTATLCFWALGFGLMFGESAGGVIGTSHFAPGWDATVMSIAPLVFFQMAFASTAVTIVSGAVAERASFAGYLAFTLAMASVIYPVAGHAVWGGVLLPGQEGWLAALGFVDFAGGTVVHSVGGWAALAFCIALGPRLGRFGRRPRRFDSSSVSQAALGVLLLWIGWAGFNAGSALAYDESVSAIVLRTMLGAAAGGVTAMALSWTLLGHASAHLTLNGVLAGLVAGTAGVHLYSGLDAIVVGAAGALAMVAASFALFRTRIDDVVEAVPVHLAPGIVGTLAVAALAPAEALPAGGRLAQAGVQAVGVLAVGAWTLAATAATLALQSRLHPLRVTPREEIRGLDAVEHRIGNAFLDLVDDMRGHQRTGRFTPRARVEPSTEAGLLAHRYNKVLDRVEAEIAARMEAVRGEREMRHLVERSYDALKAAQEENARVAREDRLTGLGNRLLLDEIVGDDSGSGGATLVVAIDLDRFKSINDRHGHAAGDEVLRATAGRLRAVIREGRDFAFRIGGDEFVLLVDWSGAQADPFDFCETLRADLTAPIAVRVLSLEPGASIGYALQDSASGTLRDTLREADMALYSAKHAGRGGTVPYTREIGNSYTAHVEELEFFRNAFARDEFFAVFQPQVFAATGAVAGCEALARWRHPRRGVLGPDQFLPLAEELNLVADLDRRILDHALAAHAAMRAHGLDPGSISVNVSARRLGSVDLLEELRARPSLPAGLTFEILETAHLDTLDADLSVTIAALKGMGIRIEVDDFGTGHASLASLLALRPDALKIDRMFAQGVDTDGGRRELMSALLEMAARFGAEAVVEGVERAAQARVLADLGAERLQGYHYARPLELPDYINWALRRGAGRAA